MTFEQAIAVLEDVSSFCAGDSRRSSALARASRRHSLSGSALALLPLRRSGLDSL